MPEDPTKTPTLFGRQKTKKLSARQQKLVDTRLAELKLNSNEPYETVKPWVEAKPLWLEIGFGGGVETIDNFIHIVNRNLHDRFPTGAK